MVLQYNIFYYPIERGRKEHIMNNVILSGRLTGNPEITTSGEGSCIAKFCLAVDGPIRKNQEKDTDFFNITAFGKKRSLLVNI